MNEGVYTCTHGYAGDNPSGSMKLVLMMYDGSISFLSKAVAYAEKGDVRNRNISANKANDIIIELNRAVDDEVGGDFSRNLKWLYSFMNRHLIESIQKDEIQGLKDVLKMLSNLRDGWAYVDHWVQVNPAQEPDLPSAVAR